MYEYFLTFGAEVELFWRKKFNGATVLFFLNRYLVLFYQMLVFRRHWIFTDLSSCTVYYNSSQAIIILCYVPWGAFSALRVLALARQRRVLVAATIFLLSIGPVITNFAIFHLSTVAIDRWGNCVGVNYLSAALALRLTIISRVCLIAADVMVIAATWSPTYEIATTVRAGFGKRRTTLSFLMLRDGLIYFVIMVTMNVLHLVLTSSSVLIGADHSSVITEFTEVLTTILVSRFMLNLQEAALRQVATKSDCESIPTGESISSLRFDGIVRCFGGSLCPTILDEEPRDEEEQSEPA